MRLITEKLLTAAFGLAAVLMTGNPAIADTIKVNGGAAPMENVFNPIKAPFEASSGMTMELKNVGPEDAFKALAGGEIDLAAAGLNINDWFDLTEKSGFAIPDKTVYKPRVVGKDKIQVYTHKGVTVAALSKDQLKQIFSGAATNWKQVGGPDLPIVVVLSAKAGGTNKVFAKQILDGGEYVKGYKEVAGNSVDARAAAAVTPGAIGIGPLAGNDGSMNLPTTPEVSRPITVLTKGAPTEKVLKLFKFLDTEGQKLIVK